MQNAKCKMINEGSLRSDYIRAGALYFLQIHRQLSKISPVGRFPHGVGLFPFQGSEILPPLKGEVADRRSDGGVNRSYRERRYGGSPLTDGQLADTAMGVPTLNLRQPCSLYPKPRARLRIAHCELRIESAFCAEKKYCRSAPTVFLLLILNYCIKMKFTKLSIPAS